jgi:hypothetical protein
MMPKLFQGYQLHIITLMDCQYTVFCVVFSIKMAKIYILTGDPISTQNHSCRELLTKTLFFHQQSG